MTCRNGGDCLDPLDCHCAWDDSDCIEVSGKGDTDNPITFSPVIDPDPDNNPNTPFAQLTSKLIDINNVEYVRWMQEAAVRHFDSVGGNRLMSAAGATSTVGAPENRDTSSRPSRSARRCAGAPCGGRTWIRRTATRRARALTEIAHDRPGWREARVPGSLAHRRALPPPR